MEYNKIRRKSREITIGNCKIGGNAPIAIQSMTNTDTNDKNATVAQVKALEQAGCDIVRVTVPTPESADIITAIREAGVKIPVVADIHFDYKSALRAIELGFDKIRINPGNIGSEDKIRAVAESANAKNIPINGNIISKQRLQSSIMDFHKRYINR